MSVLQDLYGRSLSLLTDLYQLTMAQGYWRHGRSHVEGCFHLSFRSCPFGGGYAIACGLGTLVELLEGFRFTGDDLAALAALRDEGDRPIFETAFLDHLGGLRLRCDVDAVLEGTAVFPYEPLVRVRGPLLEAQLLETVILNVINFQTLVATKASRICEAAGDTPVMEFGLRRAQGFDGAITASRAAYVGGCDRTSNVLAGHLHGIGVSGTHAHSWVMSYPDELEAFQAYADAVPGACTLLVDTYDTLEGVRKAIRVARSLRERGREVAAIRLDSGDLAYLSIEARRILDEAGLESVRIVASNDLDEHVIQSLRQQGARIDGWGVGTRLVTAHDQPAFGGVYKLSALRSERAVGGPWEDRLKLSESVAKISIPGVLQVRRYRGRDGFLADMIVDERRPSVDAPRPDEDAPVIVDPKDATRRRPLDDAEGYEELLVPVLRGGDRVLDVPALGAARDRRRAQLDALHPGIRRFVNPHEYPVGLEERLFEHRLRLIRETREALPRWRGRAHRSDA